MHRRRRNVQKPLVRYDRAPGRHRRRGRHARPATLVRAKTGAVTAAGLTTFAIGLVAFIAVESAQVLAAVIG